MAQSRSETLRPSGGLPSLFPVAIAKPADGTIRLFIGSRSLLMVYSVGIDEGDGTGWAALNGGVGLVTRYWTYTLPSVQRVFGRARLRLAITDLLVVEIDHHDPGPIEGWFSGNSWWDAYGTPAYVTGAAGDIDSGVWVRRLTTVLFGNAPERRNTVIRDEGMRIGWLGDEALWRPPIDEYGWPIDSTMPGGDGAV